VRGTDPALEALGYIQQLNWRGRRVTARRSRVGGERVEAPVGHVTERGVGWCSMAPRRSTRACTRWRPSRR
jgi:hypothetical protein